MLNLKKKYLNLIFDYIIHFDSNDYSIRKKSRRYLEQRLSIKK